jgi:hypothetical protein
VQEYGPSPVALVMAVAALFAAALSIGLAAGTLGDPDQRATTHTTLRSSPVRDAGTPARDYATVQGPARTLAPAGDPAGRDIGSSVALCPAGTRVISGGYETMIGGGGVFHSGALHRIGWAVGAVNKLPQSGAVRALAVCVSSGRSSGRRLARQRAAARREVQRLVDRYRALRDSRRSGAAGL